MSESDYESNAIVLTPMDVEYGILHDDNEVGLCEQVNYKLAEGWQLQGGVSVAVFELQGFPNFRYSQAIVFYSEAEKKEDPQGALAGNPQ